jgi:anti-sigma B factor antagonist
VREKRAVQLVMCSDAPAAASKGAIGRLRMYTTVDEARHVIRLDGELDIASASLLEAAVAEACGDGAREVVLDMARIEFMDSMGLKAILRSQKLCEEHGCALVLTPAQRTVEGVLQTTNVLNRLSFRRAG